MGHMPSTDEIRMMVREALRSIAPEAKAGAAGNTAGKMSGQQGEQGVDIARQIRSDLQRGGASTIPVKMSGDFDLNLFAGRILSLADADDIRRAMAEGKVRFSMDGVDATVVAGRGATGVAMTQKPVGGVCKIEKGILSETKIAEIAKSFSCVEIGPAVVLTPLGRDRARELKIELRRRRP